jgi:hypothetical protein
MSSGLRKLQSEGVNHFFAVLYEFELISRTEMSCARPGDIPQFIIKLRRISRKNTSYSVIVTSVHLGSFKHNWVGKIAFALSQARLI